MKEIVKLVVSLGLVCAIGCAALALVNEKTASARKEVKQKILNDNLLMTLPAGTKCVFDEKMNLEFETDGKTVIFHRAYDEGHKLVAVVAETAGHGFGGTIRLLVSINAATAKISRVVVTEHKETPGLGSQATERKVEKSLWKSSELKEGELPPNNFLDKSFIGKDVMEFHRVKSASPDYPDEIEAVSGATYSSHGVIEGVNLACKTFRAHRDKILKQ